MKHSHQRSDGVAEAVRLRAPVEADSDALFALVDFQRSYLRRWLPWLDGIESAAQSLAFIQGALERERQGTGRTRLIDYRDELSGVVGFNSIDAANRSCEIGYWLRADRQGHGIMTHCVDALLEQAFSELELNRVVIRVAPDNRPSRAIPERLGFVQEGVLREAEWLYDHFVDGVIYGLLREEWIARSGA